MDAQDGSISKRSPEFCIDMSATEMVTEQASQDMGSKDMETDQASQDCRKMTKDVHKERSSEAMATDTASQAGCRTTKEANKEGSSEGMATDKASEDGCNTTREVHERGSSQGTKPHKASFDDHETTREVREEGSSKGMVALGEDFNRLLEQKHIISGSIEVHGKGSSEGMTSNKAFQDGLNTARAFQDSPDTDGEHNEGSPEDLPALTQDLVGWCLEQENMMSESKEHKEGSSEDKLAIEEDFQGWLKQLDMRSAKVKLEVVVNADFLPWFDAVLKGNWEEIEKILNGNPTAMITKVMKIEDKPESDHLTMLDVAIMTGQDQLVEKLVNHLPPELEELNPRRAIRYAARRGRMRMVKALLDKIGHEPTIIHDALLLAVESAPDQKELLWYLARRLKCTPEVDIMAKLIILGHTDILLYLARKYPDSWKFEDLEDATILKLLGAMTPYFPSGDRLNFWENCVYKFIPLRLVDTLFDDSKNTEMALAQVALNWIKIILWNLATIPAPFIKRIGELKFRHDCSFKLAKLALTRMKEDIGAIELLNILMTSGLVLDAASRGASEIVVLCLRYFPELLWNINFKLELKKEIIEGRHVELFRLAEAWPHVEFLDDCDNVKGISPLDAVTKWSSRCVTRDVSGAAFLLQRELQWFQVAAAPFGAGSKVKFQLNRKSYWEDFAEQRNELLKEAGKWMKGTSSSCSLVATLITTVAFAAAFTIPGGNDSNTGIPIFLKSGSFMVFAVADALALLCSVAATSMFLTILTSRYTIDDFLHSLPSKMVLGLTFLFLSLAFMLVAFGSTLTIFLSERWKWSYIPITLLAAFPIALFIILQLPLYIEMVESTYWPRLYRPLTHKK